MDSAGPLTAARCQRLNERADHAANQLRLLRLGVRGKASGLRPRTKRLRPKGRSCCPRCSSPWTEYVYRRVGSSFHGGSAPRMSATADPSLEGPWTLAPKNKSDMDVGARAANSSKTYSLLILVVRRSSTTCPHLASNTHDHSEACATRWFCPKPEHVPCRGCLQHTGTGTSLRSLSMLGR